MGASVLGVLSIRPANPGLGSSCSHQHLCARLAYMPAKWGCPDFRVVRQEYATLRDTSYYAQGNLYSLLPNVLICLRSDDVPLAEGDQNRCYEV